MLFFQERNYRGRKVLGDEIPLGVQCTSTSGVPSAPTAAPVMTIYSDAGTKIVQKSLPPSDKYGATGLFGVNQPLNSSFATGRYWVLYTYAVSGNNRNALDSFEVVGGGSTSGQRIAMAWMDRPDGNDWLISQTNQGSIQMDRGIHL